MVQEVGAGPVVGAAPWRREPLPRDWGARRRAVLERDGHRCTWVTGKHDGGWDPVTQRPQEGGSPDNTPLTELTGYVYDIPARCPETTGLEVDHTRGTGEHHPSYLRTLCSTHHQWRTSKMAAMARWAKHQTQGEPHPGFKRNS